MHSCVIYNVFWISDHAVAKASLRTSNAAAKVQSNCTSNYIDSSHGSDRARFRNVQVRFGQVLKRSLTHDFLR